LLFCNTHFVFFFSLSIFHSDYKYYIRTVFNIVSTAWLRVMFEMEQY